ncbi:PASTA domain-containing protein [Yinghuangia seranimata]|uniref:PASTA domain-containing protein n=1 Tax=Yinghuangia seranimata TaxID=408067 RepID=UPI00248CFD4E|nr:PASTA domain-containing protein [Yinghuangia seranimata]MDI2128587.1 PASTA domain-containing protein [Yinghuangia seranimata]
MLHCIICGTDNEDAVQYCAGPECGSDLAGQREARTGLLVQVTCEPPDAAAHAGETVEATLTVRNAGRIPDRYVLELRRDVGDRVTVERHGKAGDVAPGGTTTWTVRYAVPQDWDPAGRLAGVGGLFGVPGADAAGHALDAADGPGDTLEVPLRIVSTRDRRAAAGALLTVYAAELPSYDPLHDGAGGTGAGGRNRRTWLAAGGAVAAVALVVALIVGMAAAGTGGGKKDPTKRAAATSTAPASPGDVVAPPAEVPTLLTEAPTQSPTRTRSASPTKTSASPTRQDPEPGPSTEPGPNPPTKPQTSAPGTSPSSSSSGLKPIPSVIGKNQSDAVGTLTGHGFDVKVNNGRCGGGEACIVVGQKPGGGTMAQEGTTVTITMGPKSPITISPLG